MDYTPSDIGNIQFEPYTSNDPRRSSRKSAIRQPDPGMISLNQMPPTKRRGRPPGAKNKIPRTTPAKQAAISKTARSASRATSTRRSTSNTRRSATGARETSYYGAGTSDSAEIVFKWKNKKFQHGYIRIPKPAEIIKMVEHCDVIQRLRIELFETIQEVLEDADPAKISNLETRKRVMKSCIESLEYALDPNSVQETDLPSIDNPNVADLGIWVSFFGTSFFEMVQQITDVCQYAVSLFGDVRNKKFTDIKRRVGAEKAKFKNSITGFKLVGESWQMVKSSCWKDFVAGQKK